MLFGKELTLVALIINHNLGSEMALSLMEKNQNSLGKDLKAAASGAKINSASDGASEYAISRRLEVEELGLGQDIANVKTGGDMLAVAEGGIQQVIENLRDMKKLAINAANDTNTDADRATIEKEFSHRMETITDISATTNYNGKLLLAGDYHRSFSRIEPVTYYTSTPTTVTVGPPSVSYVPGANGVLSIVQDNDISSMTSKFTAVAGTSTRAITNVHCNDAANTICPTGFTGSNMKVLIDFSGALKSGSAATIADFDGEGFSILCGGCPQYINIKFDSNIPPSSSTCQPATLTSSPETVNYTIGISGVSNVADLPAAWFAGLQAAHGTTGNSAKIHLRHELNLTTDGVNYYMEKTSNQIGLFDQGTILTQTKDPTVNPGTTTIAGPTTMTYNNWVKHTKEEEIFHPGNPLVIHDTTHASNAIHVFIDSMHPRAITGKVPERDPITWEIKAKKDPQTGEILKDNDGNPIPKKYIDPDPKLEDAHVRTREEALLATDILDMALNYALDQITDIGAYRSRLEQDEDKIAIQQESAIGSKSTIQDADMAETMMNFTKHNVLTQAAQLMLAQSNQNASRVLSLLQ